VSPDNDVSMYYKLWANSPSNDGRASTGNNINEPKCPNVAYYYPAYAVIAVFVSTVYKRILVWLNLVGLLVENCVQENFGLIEFGWTFGAKLGDTDTQVYTSSQCSHDVDVMRRDEAWPIHQWEDEEWMNKTIS